MADLVTIYHHETGRVQQVPEYYLGRYLGYGWSTSPPPPSAQGPGESVTTSGTTQTQVTQYANQYSNLTRSEVASIYKAGGFTREQALQILTTDRKSTSLSGISITPGLSFAEANLFLGMPLGEEEPTMQVQAGMPSELFPVMEQLEYWLRDWARMSGSDNPNAEASSILAYFEPQLQHAVFANVMEFGIPGGETGYRGPLSPAKIEALVAAGKNFLNESWIQNNPAGASGYGSGRGLSASSFDKEMLADQIEGMWQLYLRGKPNRNSSALAKEYIDLVVKNPNKAIDFSTWVKARMEEDPRWRFAFQQKPDGISEEQYMQQYAGAVTSVIGNTPGVDEIIRNAAALASTNDELAGRLMGHENVQRSSGFFNKIESRYRSLRNVIGAL